MKQFILKRLGITAILIFCVATIVFFMMHLMPGDPVLQMLGTDTAPDPAVVESLREELGLNKPILIQYKDWMINALKGDLGMSYSERIPVVESIGIRLPKTIELALVSLALAAIIGIPLGVIAALKRGKVIDYLLMWFSSLGISVPVYVLGLVFVMIFALNIFDLNIFTLPPSGYFDFSKDAGEHIVRLILPSVTIALGLAASIIRMTRSSVLEALSSGSVQPLRAKGLTEKTVVYKHVMRNALIPIVTIIGLQLGTLVGGTVLVESVFNWPGLSTLLVRAINFRDYPLIQGCILVMSMIFIITNLIVDILYGLLDPRAR